MTLIDDPEARPRRPRHRLTSVLGQRSVRLAALGWVAGNAVVLAVAGDRLPFDWPSVAPLGPLGEPAQ